MGLNFHGASGLVYSCYAYVLIDYLFVFMQKDKRNKTNVIFGAIMLILIYFAMCFNGGTQTFGFEWYPYDLMYNAGHYYSFVAGAIVSLMIQISQFGTSSKENKKVSLIKQIVKKRKKNK